MSATCWYCDAPLDAVAITTEGLLLPRKPALGGPLWIIVCPHCGTEGGAERNAAGDLLIVPRYRPGLTGWIATAFDRRRTLLRARARHWFRTNAELRSRFHAAPARPWPTPEPPLRESPIDGPAATPEEPRAEPPPSRDGPKEVGALIEHYRALGVPLTAGRREIAAAYRRASQRCHPDKVASLDEEFQALADRKFRALREAYEAVTRSLPKED